LGEAGKQFDPDAVAAFRELQHAFNDVWRQTQA
jgi:HD-GYP domain-containing protein (c-di-GMP phosphodiesterase class II)